MKNYIIRPFLLLLVVSFSFNALAQKRYWIFLSDKNGVSFDPESYFDKATITKRLEKGIELFQYSDYPLREDYVARVEKIAGRKCTQSRWFNALALEANDDQITQIRQEPFVIDIKEIVTKSIPMGDDIDSTLDESEINLAQLQMNSLGSKYFEKNNFDGKGIRIAIFDIGFPGVDKSPFFKHIRDEGRIIATYNFVTRDSFVYDSNSHGTSVLTCIAGKLGDRKFGLATGAEFLLARTEVKREVFSEEENWLAAAEWADKNGADIINSSLGYTFNRYFPKQMDGKFTLVTRAANMAASKGMLVINAAGNDGDEEWEVIGAPADADSVLSIGGISPETGIHIKFSSFGPTYDNRMKPNVCAFGEVATSDAKKVKISFGTSFSSPLISGFAACVLQMHPDWSNMQAFDEIQKSGHLYPYYDYAHGYGVPQASYFTGDRKQADPGFNFIEENDSIKVILFPKEIPDRQIDSEEAENIETKKKNSCLEGYDLDTDYLYFRIMNKQTGKIRRYGVVNMKGSDSFALPKDSFKMEEAISVYYNGYVNSHQF